MSLLSKILKLLRSIFSKKKKKGYLVQVLLSVVNPSVFLPSMHGSICWENLVASLWLLLTASLQTERNWSPASGGRVSNLQKWLFHFHICPRIESYCFLFSNQLETKKKESNSYIFYYFVGVERASIMGKDDDFSSILSISDGTSKQTSEVC